MPDRQFDPTSAKKDELVSWVDPSHRIAGCDLIDKRTFGFIENGILDRPTQPGGLAFAKEMASRIFDRCAALTRP
jgi:hypothetical protein